MKLILIISMVYSFYFSSLGVQQHLKSEVCIDISTINIKHGDILKEFIITQRLEDGEAVTGKLKRFQTTHNGKPYYIELNETYCFLKSPYLEEVYSNFEVKVVDVKER